MAVRSPIPVRKRIKPSARSAKQPKLSLSETRTQSTRLCRQPVDIERLNAATKGVRMRGA